MGTTNRAPSRGSAGNVPTHDVVAILRDADVQGEQREYFQELGPAWINEKGNISFTLRVVPLQMLCGEHVQIVVRKRNQDRGQR